MQHPTRVSTIAILLGFLAAGAVATAQSEYVILYPGAGSASTTLDVYTPISGGLLSTASIASLPAGTFQILPMPDGTRFYLIANGGIPLSVLDSAFQTVQQIAGSVPSANAAALTPDGTKLVVLTSGGVYIVQTSTNTLISQTPIPITGNPVDLAMSFDSDSAYVLSEGSVGSPTGTVVTKIDLSQLIPVLSGTPLTLPNDPSSPATGIVIAPTGFLYLSNNYSVYQINPVTLNAVEIGIEAYPGKPYITPDGQYLLCVNLRPAQGGTSFVQVNLATNSPTGASVVKDILSTFYPEGLNGSGAEILYAVAQSGALYDVVLGSNGSPPSVVPSALNVYFGSGSTAPTFAGVAFSDEVPPKLMWATNFVLNAFTLFQLDLTSRSLAPTTLPTSASTLTLGTLAVGPQAGGSLLNGFNLTQPAVGPGQQLPLPLIVQLTDLEGRGVYRGQITFQSSTPGVVIQNPSFITGSGGFAETTVIAPTTPGPFTVTASAVGVNPVTYTFTVTGTTTTGGGSNLGGIFYESGDGQLVPSQYISSPMVVQVRDSNGNPVSGATVGFGITAGSGNLELNSVTSDVNGMAAVQFLAPEVDQSLSFQQTTIQATGPTGNTLNFTITTYIQELPNNLGLAAQPTVEEVAGLFPGTAYRTLSGSAGSIIKGAYQVYIQSAAGPQTGSPIPNVGMRFTNDPAGGLVQQSDCGINGVSSCVYANCAGDPLSDTTGLLSCDLQIGQTIGRGVIYPIVGESQQLNAITLIVSPGAPGKIAVVSGNNQSGIPGAPLPVQFQVKVTDASGNPLGNVAVAWSVTQGTATLSTTTSTTSAAGITGINVGLGSSPGPVTVKAEVSATLFALFNATATVVVASVTPVSGDNQNTFTNTVFGLPLVVVVKDQQGNPVPNTQVNFSATLGALVTPATATTGSAGTASTTVTAGAAAGTVVVTAIADGFQASFVNLQVALPGPQVTSASFLTAYSLLPGLTPCGLGVVQATGIAPGVVGTVQPSGFGPNPTSLGPVQSLNIGGYAAPLTFVSNTNGVQQVGFQTPCEVPVGTTTVIMNVQGGSSTVAGVPIVAYSPGMFTTVGSDGNTYAVATRPDGSYIGPSNAAARGEVIRVYVTGLGQTTPPIGTNNAGIGGQMVNATIIGGVNNAGVLVVDAEYVAGQIGTYFVDIQVPTDTATGPYQPIAVAVQPPGGGPLIFGNGVYIPIQ